MLTLRSLVLKIGEKVHVSTECTLLILDTTMSHVEVGICRDNQPMRTETVAYGDEYLIDDITMRPLKRLNNDIVRVFISAPHDFQTDFEVAKQKSTQSTATEKADSMTPRAKPAVKIKHKSYTPDAITPCSENH